MSEIINGPFEPISFWYFEELFNSNQIMRIHEICKYTEEEIALTTGSKIETQNTNIRKNKISWHDNEELYSMIRPTINYVNEVTNWNYNLTRLEPAQYSIYYDDNNHFSWHSDTIVNDPLMNNEHPDHILKGTTRKISCTIQLSDPEEYDGGKFELLNSIHKHEEGKFELEPFTVPKIQKKGAALFFPSYTYHRVTPVTRGIRKSLVFWFRGPKWT